MPGPRCASAGLSPCNSCNSSLATSSADPTRLGGGHAPASGRDATADGGPALATADLGGAEWADGEARQARLGEAET